MCVSTTKGKTIGSSKKKATWLFGWRGEEKTHSVSFTHSLITGKRILTEDGRVVTTSTSLLSFEFSHGWGSNGHIFRVEATNGVSKSAVFKFFIDGDSYDTFPTREEQREEDDRHLNSAILASLNKSGGGVSCSSSSSNVNNNNDNNNNNNNNNSSSSGSKLDGSYGKSVNRSQSPAVTNKSKGQKSKIATSLSSSTSSSISSKAQSMIHSHNRSNDCKGGTDNNDNSNNNNNNNNNSNNINDDRGSSKEHKKIEVIRSQNNLIEFDLLDGPVMPTNDKGDYDNSEDGKKSLVISTTDEDLVHVNATATGDIDFFTPRQQQQPLHFNDALINELPPSRF